MVINSIHGPFMDIDGHSCDLEFDAEFDGEAVVGVVLPVAVIMVPDGAVMLRIDNQVGTLCAVAQRSVDGESVIQPHAATQRGVEHHTESLVTQGVTHAAIKIRRESALQQVKAHIGKHRKHIDIF